MAEDFSTYPDHNIDPRDKGFDWILQYLKAAWAGNNLFTPLSSFWNGRFKYAEIEQYAMGKQSINKYKKLQAGEDLDDKTELNNDSSVVSLLPKFLDIALSKLMQRQYDIQAHAVDPLSKSEEDAMFNEMKVKIMMREAAQKMGSDLAQSPVLAPQDGEPQDMEQLKMLMDYDYKHQMCVESEQAIQLILQQNNFEEKRKQTNKGSLNHGIAGYKVWINENGQVKFDSVSSETLITSYCVKPDFSDASHIGEAREVMIADIVPYFTKEQIKDIVNQVAGKYGNPAQNTLVYSGRYWDKFKVLVFDCQFFSWNTTVYKEEIDGKGNARFGKTHYQNIANANNAYPSALIDNQVTDYAGLYKGGEPTPKYMSTTKKVVYKGCWLVGTEYMYNWGLKENQNRKLSSWWDTQLDYILYSWNFYRMQYSGITERLIPIADAYMLTWRKLQNLKNKLIPYLINLDLNALESVALGKGGSDMTPANIIDFAFSNYILMYRSTDLLSSNPNYKPMSIEASGQLVAFTQLYQDLQMNVQQMRDISGLNEITDGSAPNPKNLNSTNAAALQGTNNALYLIQNADRNLTIRLADMIMQKIQIAVQLGKVAGYVKPLGASTVKFLEIDPELANRELGIFIDDAPTDEERAMLLQELNLKDSQGLIEPSDKILVMSCRNLKQAAQMLAYAVKKRREMMQQQQLEVQQQATQGQMQLQQQTEQMKQATIQMQLQGQMQLENLKGEWMYRIEMMKKENDANEAQIQAQSKVISNQVMAAAKVDSAHIAAGSSLVKSHMDNEAAKEVSKNKKTA